MRSKVSAAGPALMPGSRAMVTHPSSTVNVPGASGHVDSWSSQCSPTTLSQPKGFASAEFRESRQVFHSVTNWFTSNTPCCRCCGHRVAVAGSPSPARSEEHTSELQSRFELVCRLLLEKKNKQNETKRSKQAGE